MLGGRSNDMQQMLGAVQGQGPMQQPGNIEELLSMLMESGILNNPQLQQAYQGFTGQSVNDAMVGGAQNMNAPQQTQPPMQPQAPIQQQAMDPNVERLYAEAEQLFADVVDPQEKAQLMSEYVATLMGGQQ